jgi:hypothetical protein
LIHRRIIGSVTPSSGDQLLRTALMHFPSAPAIDKWSEEFLGSTSAVGGSERRWHYNHDRVQQRARRLKDARDEFHGHYRWRAGIEATMSRFKHQMGMARLRVRGMAKVTYTAMLRALGLNIHRVAA